MRAIGRWDRRGRALVVVSVLAGGIWLFVLLIVAVGVLAVTSGSALLQADDAPTMVTGANESTPAPGAQLARAISAEGAHLNRTLHQQPLDTTPTTAPTSTGTENGADDDSEERTETDDKTESDDATESDDETDDK